MTRPRYWSIGDRRHPRRDQRHRPFRHQPHPSASFCLQATGTDGDGSQSCFTFRGHFVLDKSTGEVRRNTIISTRRVS